MRDFSPLSGDATTVTIAGKRRAWDETTDVVVVGLGAAGGATAIEARAQGADVLVVDRFEGGGATGRSAGAIYFGGGTDLQRAHGYEDSPDNMFAYLKLETADAVPDSTLQAFCETSVENFEWLRRLGVPFPKSGEVCKASLPPDDCTLYFSGNELCPPYCDAATPAPRGHRPLGDGLTGHLTGTALRRGTIDAGAELRTFTRADRLVTNSAGRVVGLAITELPRWLTRAGSLMGELIHYGGGMMRRTGNAMQSMLRALERSGTRRYIRARGGVVLCAGGYVFDPQLMAQTAPDYARCTLRLGTAGDDGAGIRMGTAVGGATGQMHRCSAPRFVDPPSAWWRGIFVDRRGDRICNETLYGGKIGDYLVDEHGGRAHLIVDDATMQLGRRQVFGSGVHAYQRVFGLINGWLNARSADTLEELARRLGIDANGLRHTVDRYNLGVLDAQDEHGKSTEHLSPIVAPPFWGIPLDTDMMLFPTPCLTLGGLRTEGDTSRVMRADGSPIEGLYAAGRTAVGVASNGYASGLSISDGIFAGRNAGRHATSRLGITVSMTRPAAAQ